MGQSKTTVSSNTTTTPEATPEEAELNKLEIERQKRLLEPSIGVQQQGLDLVSQMLSGSTNLPGYFGQIGEGIGREGTVIGDQDINQLVTRSLEDIYPQFQNQGILDSGVAAELSARTAADVRSQAAQFNAQQDYSRQAYNQGNILNLLGLGISGQAQVQQPVIAYNQTLSERLAGLRPTTTVGGGTTISPRQQSYGWGLFSQG